MHDQGKRDKQLSQVPFYAHKTVILHVDDNESMRNKTHKMHDLIEIM